MAEELTQMVCEACRFGAPTVTDEEMAQFKPQVPDHPALLTEWGKVTVSWWTHKIRGLHKNDFIMAAKTDQLYT